MTPAHLEADRRIQLALAKVEQAQNLLNGACSDISSVVGLVKEWERLGKLADKAKAEWHRLRSRTVGGAWKLDEDSARAFLARSKP